MYLMMTSVGHGFTSNQTLTVLEAVNGNKVSNHHHIIIAILESLMPSEHDYDDVMNMVMIYLHCDGEHDEDVDDEHDMTQ